MFFVYAAFLPSLVTSKTKATPVSTWVVAAGMSRSGVSRRVPAGMSVVRATRPLRYRIPGPASVKSPTPEEIVTGAAPPG